MNRILLLLLMSLCLFYTGVNCGGQGLVSPQSACKIRCENGGMCVFDLEQPNRHSCICLLGVFTGDRCQTRIAIAEDPSSKTHSITPGRKAASAGNDEAAREEARRRDEERKREYEKQVAERSRQEKEKEDRMRVQEDERRRQQQQEQYWKEENVRREKERQESEKRHEEARKAHEERLRQYEEDKVRREEQRREEEQRRIIAQKQQEEERVREEERRRLAMEKEMSDKKVEAINEQWEYKEGEDDDYIQVAEKDDYETGEESINQQKDNRQDMADHRSDFELCQSDISDDNRNYFDEGLTQSNTLSSLLQKLKERFEVIRTEPSSESMGSMDSKEELNAEDEKVVKSISSVFNKAVEETIRAHPINDEQEEKMEEEDSQSEEMEKETENEDADEKLEEEDEKLVHGVSKAFEKAIDETTKAHPEYNTDGNDDDYWDHTPKKTDEDYERDNEERRIDGNRNADGEEYGMEEGQEGWMMVKKEEQNSSYFSSSLFLSFVISSILLFL